MSRALICLLVLLNGVSAVEAARPAEAAAQMLDSAAAVSQTDTAPHYYQQFEIFAGDRSQDSLAVLGAAAPVISADPAETISSPLTRHDILRE